MASVSPKASLLAAGTIIVDLGAAGLPGRAQTHIWAIVVSVALGHVAVDQCTFGANSGAPVGHDRSVARDPKRIEVVGLRSPLRLRTTVTEIRPIATDERAREREPVSSKITG